MSSENNYSGNRSNTGGVAAALFVGLIMGGILGILFAPKSGKETRKELIEKSEKIIDKGKESLEDVVEKTRDLAQVGKQKIEELKIAGEEIWDKGKKKVEDTAKKIKIVVSESKTKAKEAEDFLS
jgi:gas vesicle protein